MIIIAGLKTITGKSVMTDTSKLNPEINEHLMKENLYTKQVLEDLEPLREKLLQEMKGRLEPNTSTVPSPDYKYAYNHKYEDNDEHGIYQRFPIRSNNKGNIRINLKLYLMQKNFQNLTHLILTLAM